MGLPHYYLGWLAFCLASFSIIGNDSIQTLGTFIESTKSVHWIPKTTVFCLFTFGVVVWGWFFYKGEIHFNRLSSNGSSFGFPYPQQFNLIQLIVPIILFIFNRLKASISTTFLVLSLFGSNNIDRMMVKSFLGYGIAFLIGLLVWFVLCKKDMNEYYKLEQPNPPKENAWFVLQWFSTTILWVSWLYQDVANMAVYIPRQLNTIELVFAMGIICSALLFTFWNHGGKIQEIVTHKTDTTHLKEATLIDLVYTAILFFFGFISKMPMSTTWVFLGLLAGREIIIHMVTKRDRPYLETFRQVGKDVMLASLGITISISFFILSTYIYSGELLGLDTILNLSKYLSIAQ